MSNKNKILVYGTIQSISEAPTDSIAKARAIAEKLEARDKMPAGLVSQPDALVISAVMLTTGRPGNLNDDVMLNEDVLPVLYTAKLKPLNIEHTKMMVGTIFDVFAIDPRDGTVVHGVDSYNEKWTNADLLQAQKDVMAKASNYNENLDIVTHQLLWKGHMPELATEIRQKAISGDMFVSMEMWFENYDYLIGNRVIKRTPETAKLDSALRRNGGGGFVGAERIRRVLRNVTLAGIALVEKPANINSVILNVMDKQDTMGTSEVDEFVEDTYASTEFVNLINRNTIKVLKDEGKAKESEEIAGKLGGSKSIPMGSKIFSSTAKPEVDEVVNNSEVKRTMENAENKLVELIEKNAVLQADMTKATTALTKANKEIEELQAKNVELETKLNETLRAIETKQEELAAKASEVATASKEKDEVSAKLAEVSAKLAEIEEARRLETRKAALAGLGLSNERVVKVLAKTSTLSDEAFKAELEDLKSWVEELKVKSAEAAVPVKEEVKEEPAKVEEQATATEEEIAEVLDSATEEKSEVATALASAKVEDSAGDEDVLMAAMAKAVGVNLKK